MNESTKTKFELVENSESILSDDEADILNALRKCFGVRPKGSEMKLLETSPGNIILTFKARDVASLKDLKEKHYSACGISKILNNPDTLKRFLSDGVELGKYSKRSNCVTYYIKEIDSIPSLENDKTEYSEENYDILEKILLLQERDNFLPFDELLNRTAMIKYPNLKYMSVSSFSNGYTLIVDSDDWCFSTQEEKENWKYKITYEEVYNRYLLDRELMYKEVVDELKTLIDTHPKFHNFGNYVVDIWGYVVYISVLNEDRIKLFNEIMNVDDKELLKHFYYDNYDLEFKIELYVPLDETTGRSYK